tara:strand:- start:1187 stop:1555 length:369 start_codon:yes stop_codon:yes gene_type:complete
MKPSDKKNMRESEDILRKMLTETREIPVDHVPYAFEKRIMAHIEAAPQVAVNLWQQWSQALWRTAVPCLAVMILVAVLARPEATGPQPQPAPSAPLTAQTQSIDEELEAIVMLAIETPALDR